MSSLFLTISLYTSCINILYFIRLCTLFKQFLFQTNHVVLVIDNAHPDARLPAGLRAVQARALGFLGQVAPDADGGVPVRQGKSEVALGGRVIDRCHVFICSKLHVKILRLSDVLHR